MSIPTKIAARAIVLAGLLVWAGCSRTMLTAPVTEEAPKTSAAAPPAGDNAPPPPSRLTVSSGLLSNPLPKVLNLLSWVDICDVLVHKDETKLVSASHYALQFTPGTLASDTTITIKEYDSNVLDVQFGPHGVRFPVSVVLSIDFAGTSADPGSATYDKREPVLYWLNDRTNHWEEVPGGRTDWARKKYIVPLQHFSRYVLGGKAGWKQGPPPRED